MIEKDFSPFLTPGHIITIQSTLIMLHNFLTQFLSSTNSFPIHFSLCFSIKASLNTQQKEMLFSSHSFCNSFKLLFIQSDYKRRTGSIKIIRVKIDEFQTKDAGFERFVTSCYQHAFQLTGSDTSIDMDTHGTSNQTKNCILEKSIKIQTTRNTIDSNEILIQ